MTLVMGCIRNERYSGQEVPSTVLEMVVLKRRKLASRHFPEKSERAARLRTRGDGIRDKM